MATKRTEAGSVPSRMPKESGWIIAGHKKCKKKVDETSLNSSGYFLRTDFLISKSARRMSGGQTSTLDTSVDKNVSHSATI